MTNWPVTPVLAYSKVQPSCSCPRPSPRPCNPLRWHLILSALALFCCIALPADAPRTPAPPPASLTTPDRTADATSSKPDAPTPKLAGLDAASTGEVSAEPSPLALSSPVKPASTDSYESPTDRKIWYGLMVAGHGAAAFDAWTTRRAISEGYGVEGNPLERPFAHSGAIYATTQVTPLIMDYLGHRLMRSRHEWVRRAWWVPQAASASVSLGAAIHNYRLVP
jgi:hypothetical protein